MEQLNVIGWVAIRLAIGYVYLKAFYMNTRDSAARKWTLDHTAYMFPSLSEPMRTEIARLVALAGMLMMCLGGISILLGLEGRLGGLLLLLFTAGGVYSHKREREVAMALADKIDPLIPTEAKADFTTLKWSAFSGHFSSGLKNWGLCGICAAIIVWGTGPFSLSDRLSALFK